MSDYFFSLEFLAYVTHRLIEIRFEFQHRIPQTVPKNWLQTRQQLKFALNLNELLYVTYAYIFQARGICGNFVAGQLYQLRNLLSEKKPIFKRKMMAG